MVPLFTFPSLFVARHLSLRYSVERAAVAPAGAPILYSCVTVASLHLGPYSERLRWWLVGRGDVFSFRVSHFAFPFIHPRREFV